MTAKKTQSVVLTNNDVIYLWWSIPKKIKNCLGFSIHRIINGVEEPKGLYATVGFDRKNDKRKSPQTTDEWPVQSFNWKDLYAPRDKEIKYRIIPMIGSWDQLLPDLPNSIVTSPARKTQQYGDAKIIFNRGILSTQAFSKSGTGGKINPEEARKLITNPSSLWRNRLGGQMLENVNSFFNRAKNEGGKYYAALYELTDETLIKELTRNKGTEIILSNANSSKTEIVDGKKKTVSIDDGTNKNTRQALHKVKTITVYDRMLGTHIGHNKFVIYVNKAGKPKAVLTGSTNWTPTGLCGQTNNMVILESESIATHYLDYWKQLRDDIPEKQGASLRNWCCQHSEKGKINKDKTNITLWYSPNTKQKNKPKDAETPPDMEHVYRLIRKAKGTVLFLVFNPGSQSIIDEIKKVAATRPASKQPLFVRGAVSDAKIAEKVTTNIFSSDIAKNPDTYYFDRVTGVAAIPGPFGYFEDELLKLGFATIHDKILVIDPFDDDCVVITGSHNLGFAASFKNDENMLIIQNDKSIAQAYATHVLDVVNHFKWRYKLQSKIKKAGAKTLKEKEAVLSKGWHDLAEEDNWMNYYFNSTGFINRDKFLF
jgi:phosphatidylserine/phosphatidylglycerophosphate/cardiolipin synthase-like enzyme